MQFGGVQEAGIMGTTSIGLDQRTPTADITQPGRRYFVIECTESISKAAEFVWQAVRDGQVVVLPEDQRGGATAGSTYGELCTEICASEHVEQRVMEIDD